jgi:antitoxin Phd
MLWAMKSTWQLQEAKNRLSELVELAVHEGHQTITRHGEPTVVVVAFRDFQRLRRKRNSLVEFLQKSPLQGVKLDLHRDKSPPRKVAP